MPSIQAAPAPQTQPPTTQEQTPKPNLTEPIPGMQQSILQSTPQKEQQINQEYIPTPSPQGEYQGYEGQGYGGYEYDYQPYDYAAPGSISPDTITEISEQVVSEKIAEIRKHLEKVMDFKTTIETKTESIEERLRHIEKIIDVLQSSVLRKVGDYTTNIADIKRELIETQTQKTFTKLVPELRKKTPQKTKSTHATRKKTSKKKK